MGLFHFLALEHSEVTTIQLVKVMFSNVTDYEMYTTVP